MAKLLITFMAILIACSFALRLENQWYRGSGSKVSGSYRHSYYRSHSGYGSTETESDDSTDDSYDGGNNYDYKRYNLANINKKNTINNRDGLVFAQNNDNMDSLATYLD
jgi:hypothetical protein